MAATGQERAILIGLQLKSRSRKSSGEAAPFTAEESLEELKALAESAGAEVSLSRPAGIRAALARERNYSRESASKRRDDR